MANFTQKAIKKSFLKLLNERPLNQITVKDIVEDCGINRNSFYYHFQDLPSLVEEIVTAQADRIIQQYASIDSMENCLNAAVQFALENRRAVYHIYHSANRDLYEQHLWRVCEHVVTVYFDQLTKDCAIKESDKPIIIRFYKCVCFGQIMDWLNSGMKEDICVCFHRLFELKKGMAEELIRRSAES